ncbi:MAG: hypothetical protein ACRDT9_15015, partial [Agromyces sp.]
MSSARSAVGSTREGAEATSASTAAIVAAALGVLGLLAFAAVNIVFEGTGRFAAGPLAAYASGLSVMNWLVVGLKLFGT